MNLVDAPWRAELLSIMLPAAWWRLPVLHITNGSKHPGGEDHSQRPEKLYWEECGVVREDRELEGKLGANAALA